MRATKREQQRDKKRQDKQSWIEKTGFSGKLIRAKMPPLEKSAYTSWQDQKARCYNPQHPSFKWYGAKGIQVEYSSREFISWWIEKAKKFPIKKGLSVDRIDSTKNYAFSNIQLIPRKENCLKAALTQKKRVIYCKDSSTHSVIAIFNGYEEIKSALGIFAGSVIYNIKTERSKKGGRGKIPFSFYFSWSS